MPIPIGREQKKFKYLSWELFSPFATKSNENASSDEIKCEFETDFCDWSSLHTALSPEFKYRRETAKGIQDAGYEGPPDDHEGRNDKYFVYARGEGDAKSGLTAGEVALESPAFSQPEHPVECLEFYYYLKVNSSNW